MYKLLKIDVRIIELRCTDYWYRCTNYWIENLVNFCNRCHL